MTDPTPAPSVDLDAVKRNIERARKYSASSRKIFDGIMNEPTLRVFDALDAMTSEASALVAEVEALRADIDARRTDAGRESGGDIEST